MGARWSGWGLSLATLAALAACSGGKSGGHDAAGGTGGGGATGGSDGAAGAPDGGGRCDPQYANGYEADFDLTAAPSAGPTQLCFPSCTGVSTSFRNAAGELLNLYYAGGSCPTATRCDTCTFSACPGHSCPPPTFPQTFRWNGGIGVPNSCTTCQTPGCAPPVACQSLGCAPPGHYTATFCATSVEADAGVTCFPGTPSCTTVEFDLPSTAHTPVVLQP